MLDVFGIFFLFHFIERLLGVHVSPQPSMPTADASTLPLPGAAASSSPAASSPASAVPVAQTAIAPSGAPVALPPAAVTPSGAPASSALAPAPFPAAVPTTLPSFPANWPGGQPPGWEFATPVTPAVVKRAVALLPQLWATGAGTHTQEMTGGTWITYNAEWHAKGVKGVTAYRPRKVA
jgi:hypothetical protein